MDISHDTMNRATRYFLKNWDTETQKYDLVILLYLFISKQLRLKNLEILGMNGLCI